MKISRKKKKSVLDNVLCCTIHHFFPGQHRHDYVPFSIESSVKKNRFLYHLILSLKCMNARRFSIKQHRGLVNLSCFQVLTYDSDVHQFTFLNSTEEGKGQRQKESLRKQVTLYWGLTARASLWCRSQKVLVLCDDLILTWGTFYTPKRERGWKGMFIMWLNGSFSHQTGCDEYHLWWIVDPKVPLQPLKMNGKKENFSLCLFMVSLGNLAQLFESFP